MELSRVGAFACYQHIIQNLEGFWERETSLLLFCVKLSALMASDNLRSLLFETLSPLISTHTITYSVTGRPRRISAPFARQISPSVYFTNVSLSTYFFPDTCVFCPLPLLSFKKVINAPFFSLFFWSKNSISVRIPQTSGNRISCLKFFTVSR